MKLIATMIIKDEEANLPRCLDSIKDFVDEIVVVDTGSTDKSVEIAKSYGAHVYNQPWQNDFSLHRNESIKKAAKHGADWYFIIDGDESLAPMDVTPDEFKKRLAMLPIQVSALVVMVYEINKDGEVRMPFTGTRFFRAGRGFHYTQIAHNRPHIQGVTAACDVSMYHYGYSDPKIMQGKLERTLPLLDERVAENPDDYNALFYRCITRIGLGNIEDGIQDGIRCMELMPEHDPEKLGYYGKLYYSIGWGYLRIGDPDNAYIWFKKGQSFYPYDIDLNYSLAQLGFLCNDNDLLKTHADAYFESLDKYKENCKPRTAFATPMTREDMPIPVRHIHNATKSSEESVREWVKVEGLN